MSGGSEMSFGKDAGDLVRSEIDSWLELDEDNNQSCFADEDYDESVFRGCGHDEDDQADEDDEDDNDDGLSAGQNSMTPSSSSHQVRWRATTWTTTWSYRTSTAAATCSPPSSKTPPAATTTSMASHCWMSKIFPFWDSTSASV